MMYVHGYTMYKMNDTCNQDTVQYLVWHKGDTMLYDLTVEDNNMLNKLLLEIETHPHKAKSVYDYIFDNMEDKIEHNNVLDAIISACERLDVDIDTDIYCLKSDDNNYMSFAVLSQPKDRSCIKANIYLPPDGTEAWSKGESITAHQHMFLKSLEIEYIKWCSPVNGEYIPLVNSYKQVSKVVVDDVNQRDTMVRDLSLAAVSLGTLVMMSTGAMK